jgi:cytoskeletal protein RodZ
MNPAQNNFDGDDSQKPLPTINTNTPFNPDSTPEEDLAALQAIGALEAEDNPSNADLFAEKEDKPVAVALQPIEKEAVIEEKATFIPAPEYKPEPFEKPTPKPEVKPEPVVLISDFKPDVKPRQSETNYKPASTFDPSPLSAAIAGVLKEEPAPLVQPVKVTKPEKVKKTKKLSKKPIIVLVILLFLAAAVTGAYFAWQSMQDNAVQEAPTTQSTEAPAAVAPVSSDSNGSVSEAADSIDSYANGLSENIYQDASLSDTTLYAN